MTAPILLTDRLRLEGHRSDDLDALAAIWRDPAVYGFIGARSREEVWLRLLRSVGQWALFGYGAWVARDRASGTIVGEIGLIEARRAIDPPLDAPEMSWMIAAEAQGRGLAREGVAAALAWIGAHGIGRTVCIIDPGNLASVRIAAGAGYAMAGPRRYHDKTVDLYERAGPP